MPSNFEDGDLIEAGHLKQYSGEAFYSNAQSGSTSSAYLATVTPAPLTAYPVGMVVNFRPNADNAASPTLNVNGLGAKAIVKNGSTALAAADIKNGQVVSLVYDGTNFQLVAASTGGSSSVAALNDLTDVTISSPATGQVLRKSAGDWVNSAIQAGDLPSHNHDGSQITSGQVAPARLSSNAPNASQFLRGDGTWAAVSGGSSDLNGLTDVTITSPATGQFLRKSGADWVNSGIQAGDLPSGIDAAKIGGGAVSNTEFATLDGVTSSIQTQLNGKAASTHTHAASDITSGQMGLARGGTGSDLSATGGAGQVLKQSTAGGAVSVGALGAGDLPSGIDAAKIGGGAVSNTEFATLDGVTSSIQTQLNSKAASSHTHAAGDITSGQMGLARGGTGSDLSATGGAGQVLKQSTSGGAVSVGALAAGDMPSGIDAAKIGGGAVSNTEFAALDGVTSSIQTQLNGKAASTHTHAASDITSGQLGLARGGTGSDLSATGGAGQVLKQSTSGGAVSVGSLAASDMPSGIDATKIGSGVISNTEFGSLNGVIANVQDQLNGKLIGGGLNLVNVDHHAQRNLGFNPFVLGAGTGLSANSYQNAAVPGGLVYRMYGTGSQPTLSYIGSTFYVGFIPVDTQKTYSGRIWMSSSGGSGCYCGVRCWSESGALLGGGAYKYFLLSNVSPPSGGAWYEGLISGEGSSSWQFEVGTKYVDIVILAGYGSPPGAWEAFFSVPEFVELPSNLAAGTKLQGTGGTGHFLTQTSLSGAVSSRTLIGSDIPSGIDAAKIGGGSVSNTEFGYLDGVTSPIQSQINSLVGGLMYGDGSDGNVVISSNTVLSEPKFYNDLTINSGVSLESAFPIYVKGTLTLNGTVHANGGAAPDSPNFGEPGRGGGWVLGSFHSRWSGNNGGGGGGNWSSLDSSTPQDLRAVFSSAGGGSTTGSGVNSNTVCSSRHIIGWPTIFTGLWDGAPYADGYGVDVHRIRGGLGGGGGLKLGSSTGGGGGGGGGILRVFANSLAGSGTLSANGGKGGNASGNSGASAYGGGGGGGGVVILISRASSHSFTLSASGGAGGTGFGNYSGVTAQSGGSGVTKFYGGV